MSYEYFALANFCLLAFSLTSAVTGDDKSICQDHPRLKEACQSLPNLKSWCTGNSTNSKINHNVAEVCKASCGFCNENGNKTGGENKEENKAPPVDENLDNEGTKSSTKCDVEPDFKPCTELKEANDLFRHCCEDYKLPDKCISLCKYDVALVQAQTAVATGACPMQALESYLYCASRNRDNTPCCEAKSVLKLGGPQCSWFCDPTKKIDSLGKQHLPCATQLKSIMDCHWAGVRKMDGSDSSKR